MCFFSPPKAPQVQQAPTPPQYIAATAPSAPSQSTGGSASSEGSPRATGVSGETFSSSLEEGRKKAIERQRAGFIRTIRTSASGITGKGPDLKSAGLYGREVLG